MPVADKIEAVIEAKIREQDEFLAEYLWNKDLELFGLSGWHNPEFHINPMEVAPPIRDDGRTYCSACRIDHVPWAELRDPKKNEYRGTVARFRDGEKEAAKVLGPVNASVGKMAQKDQVSYYKQLADTNGKHLNNLKQGLEVLNKTLAKLEVVKESDDETAPEAAARVLSEYSAIVKSVNEFKGKWVDVESWVKRAGELFA